MFDVSFSERAGVDVAAEDSVEVKFCELDNENVGDGGSASDGDAIGDGVGQPLGDDVMMTLGDCWVEDCV